MSDECSEYDDTLNQRPQVTWSDFLKEHNDKLRRKHRQELLDELIADLDSEHGPFVMFSPTYETEDDMIQRKTFNEWLRTHKDERR